MTLEETKKILALNKSNYPTFYTNMNLEDSKMMLATWFNLFKEHEFETIFTIMINLIAQSQYPIKPCDINEKLYAINNTNQMTPIEAFELVKKAIRRDGNEARKNFERLPRDIQEALRNHDCLKEWADMKSDDIQKYIYPRFRDAYNNVLVDKKDNYISTSAMLELKERIAIGIEEGIKTHN